MWPSSAPRKLCRGPLLSICNQCRVYRRSKLRSRPRFSATNASSSKDASTPVTNTLPRSIFLDPHKNKTKENPRGPPPNKDRDSEFSTFEYQIMQNPFGITLLDGVTHKLEFLDRPCVKTESHNVFYPGVLS